MCGIQSADDGQLERMRKGCQQEEIFRGIELSTSAGIKLVLTLIVGYPGETQASIDTTVSFLNRHTTTNKGYSCFQVYPFYLLPNTAVDALEYRKLFDLRGRYASWSHNTMDSERATHVGAPLADCTGSSQMASVMICRIGMRSWRSGHTSQANACRELVWGANRKVYATLLRQ